MEDLWFGYIVMLQYLSFKGLVIIRHPMRLESYPNDTSGSVYVNATVDCPLEPAVSSVTMSEAGHAHERVEE